MDEATLLAEMEAAAAIGVEQFVVDAGWWSDMNREDAEDLPGPPGAPGRSIRSGSPTDWACCPIARTNSACASACGSSPSGSTAARSASRAWPRERFSRRIDARYEPCATEQRRRLRAGVPGGPGSARVGASRGSSSSSRTARPDYVKWDNNFWVNCNRPGHGHGAAGRQLPPPSGRSTTCSSSLREPLSRTSTSRTARRAATACRSTCWRYSDAAWLDDRTYPSDARPPQRRRPHRHASRRRIC